MRSNQIRNLTLALLVLTIPSMGLAQTSLDGPIIGNSEGNHRLDCTVIRPWEGDGGPADLSNGPFPVIGWGNGWGQGDVHGEGGLRFYIDGLRFWADAGDYLVIAANQWSARAPDLLQCVQWLIDESNDPASDYYATVDASKIGMSGHSQGGGAALKAGDGILMDGDGFTPVTTVVAMNPFGPSYVMAQNPNDQILLLGGTNDGATPTDSFSAVLDGVILSDNPGGAQAELIGGTHCNPACRDDFGIFGEVSLLWWDIFLRDNMGACPALIATLETEPPTWNTDYSSNFICGP
jgi:dienelactone hydrolase